MKYIQILLAMAAVAQLNAQSVVYSAGMARNVMMGTNLNAHVQLDSLLIKNHLYALGPVDNLQGEVTVLNGVPVVSQTTANNTIQTRIDSLVKAPFMVYTYAENWRYKASDACITNMGLLSDEVERIAHEMGINVNEEPFAFKVEGTFEEVKFHVIMRDINEVEHSHEKHNEAKKHFVRNNVKGTLLGFYSKHHQGVFTHKGQFIHVHFVADDKSETGHVDGLNFIQAQIGIGL